MTKSAITLASVSALAVGLTTQAFAEVPLNDSFSVAGHIAGSYSVMDPSPGPSTDHYDIDDALLLFKYTAAPVTGVASLQYVPNATSQVSLLDAYVTYDAGGGVSITGGKFLSYLGYESFFVVNNPTISFANGDFLGAIPGYHSGVKVDYSDDAIAFGGAFVDSLYGNDGEAKQNSGAEAYFTFTGVPDLTVFTGVGYESSGVTTPSSTVFDLWGSYALTKMISFAGEYTYKNVDAPTGDGYNWLGELNYAINDKYSTAFRVSGEKMKDGGPEFNRFTVAPGVAVTSALTVRLEYTYTDYKNYSADSAQFYGVQGFIKF